jgi:hypothetical protein
MSGLRPILDIGDRSGVPPTLDGLTDLTQADLIRRAAQDIAPTRSAFASNDSSLAQTLKDLLEKPIWNALTRADRLHANGLARAVVGQIENPAECVLDLA